MTQTPVYHWLLKQSLPTSHSPLITKCRLKEMHPNSQQPQTPLQKATSLCFSSNPQHVLRGYISFVTRLLFFCTASYITWLYNILSTLRCIEKNLLRTFTVRNRCLATCTRGVALHKPMTNAIVHFTVSCNWIPHNKTNFNHMLRIR